MISGVIDSRPSGFRFQSRTPRLPGTIRDSGPDLVSAPRPLKLRSRIKPEEEDKEGPVGLHMIHKATGLLDPIG